MEPVTESKVLTENSKLALQLGSFFYEIARKGKQSLLSNKEVVSCFGCHSKITIFARLSLLRSVPIRNL